MTTAIKRAIAEAGNIALLKMVRVGWELETQKLDGKTCADGDDTELDDEAASEYRYSQHREALREDILSTYISLSSGRTSGRRIANIIRERAAQRDVSTAEVLGNTFHEENNMDPSWEESAADAVRDYIEEDVDNDIEYPDSCYVSGEAEFELPRGLTWTPDQSVTGPEIKTDGPTTVTESGRLLGRLFSEHDMEVDVGCSFHVHISVPDIRHSYGSKFQGYLYEYLLSQIDRVPTSVRERWSSSAARFFKAQLSTDKMTFVNFHERLKTWEFRCFGNISNTADAMTCIRLSAEALRHAYRCQLGMVVPADTSDVINVLASTTSAEAKNLDIKLAARKDPRKVGRAA